MVHRHLDHIDQTLARLLATRRSAQPLRSDGEAIRLLLSTQDALHALVLARDKLNTVERAEAASVRALVNPALSH